MTPIGQNRAYTYLHQGLLSKRLSPSLLFTGPEGVGKKTMATELIKALFCPNINLKENPFGCETCDTCTRAQEKNHTDLLWIDRPFQAQLLKEKAGANTGIKIEMVRHLDKFLRIKPMESPRRVTVIDEAHKLTLDAANALLKILEEPPNNAQIVLATSDSRALPSTIRSRCVILQFSPISSDTLTQWIIKNHGFGEENARSIATMSAGSFSKALDIMKKGTEDVDLMDYSFDEFIDMVETANWRREGRKKAEGLLNHLIESSRSKLEEGQLHESEKLPLFLQARKQIDRHVSPKLVLENLYVKLESLK